MTSVHQPTAIKVNSTGCDAYVHPNGFVSELANEISSAVNAGPVTRRQRIVTALRSAVVRDDLLTPAQTIGRKNGYARHVVHADALGRFTILAIVWGPGQFSPVHAHHTWCAYAVQSGLLSETLYALDKASETATPLRLIERRAGFACYEDAGLDQIHRLGNAGLQSAISIHIYGVDEANAATGVNRIIAEASNARNVK